MKLIPALFVGVLQIAAVHAEVQTDSTLSLPFESSALTTPYRESLPVNERLAGLALLWSEARYNFANFDLSPGLDWDALYLETIPPVMAAEDTEAYYRELQRLVARLGDGHSNVYPPKELNERFYSRPPLYTRLIEGRVIIYLVDSLKLRSQGLAKGQEIIAIDGLPVHDCVSEAFEAEWPRLKQARGLIIDLRINGGGSSDIGYRILDRLINGDFPVSAWKTRLYRPSLRAWQREDAYPADTWAEEFEESYQGPVVVVSGPRTFSAAEDFLVAFRQAARGKIVGEPTGGSTGQPLMFDLPGGGKARLCSKRDTYADGSDFVGVGVQPDIRITETVENLRAGRDAAVARARAVVMEASVVPAD